MNVAPPTGSNSQWEEEPLPQSIAAPGILNGPLHPLHYITMKHNDFFSSKLNGRAAQSKGALRPTQAACVGPALSRMCHKAHAPQGKARSVDASTCISAAAQEHQQVMRH